MNSAIISPYVIKQIVDDINLAAREIISSIREGILNIEILSNSNAMRQPIV